MGIFVKKIVVCLGLGPRHTNPIFKQHRLENNKTVLENTEGEGETFSNLIC